MSLLTSTLKYFVFRRPNADTAKLQTESDLVASVKRQQHAVVEFDGHNILFRTPNDMTAWRVASFYQKEPDTVAWLLRMPPGSVFLDVGANVGMYTLAAAVGRNCQVFAFEPESQNYALLNANIALNRAGDRVVAYCAALTDKTRFDRLYLSEFDPDGGGSCHSFGAEVDFNLNSRNSPFAQGCIGLHLDELVSNGVVPVPDFIKIDVDGFEHLVVEGALSTLQEQRVREVLIEINPAIPEHQALMQRMATLGYYYDADQQRRAARKDGVFKGVGEIIFRRAKRDIIQISYDTLPRLDTKEMAPRVADHAVLDHVLDRIGKTDIKAYPFPHMVVDDVFPNLYYQKILQHFPSDSVMQPISETGRTDASYKDRLVCLFNAEHFNRLQPHDREFWLGFADWLYSDRFINGVIDKFWPHVACRLTDLNQQGAGVKLHGDALIVSDKTNYAIGPHTDQPHRLITFLFYLPKDTSMAGLGTSIYSPKIPFYECNGSKHHQFESFERLETVAFIPNRCLIFVRNNASFHGVEPIVMTDPERHLIIFNIRIASST